MGLQCIENSVWMKLISIKKIVDKNTCIVYQHAIHLNCVWCNEKPQKNQWMIKVL